MIIRIEPQRAYVILPPPHLEKDQAAVIQWNVMTVPPDRKLLMDLRRGLILDAGGNICEVFDERMGETLVDPLEPFSGGVKASGGS